MAPGFASIDTELVLHAEDVSIVEVEKVGGSAIGIQILFPQLETDSIIVGIGVRSIVDCSDIAVRIRGLPRNCFAEVVRECGDTAKPWGKITKKGNPIRERGVAQYDLLSAWDILH
jgi:hypothetical protein